MQLLESPSDSELKFRKFLEVKQKSIIFASYAMQLKIIIFNRFFTFIEIDEYDLIDCSDSLGGNSEVRSASTGKFKRSIPKIEINGEKSIDLDVGSPKTNCCDGMSQVIKNAFSKILSTFLISKQKVGNTIDL